jgi:hypothetical protein
MLTISTKRVGRGILASSAGAVVTGVLLVAAIGGQAQSKSEAAGRDKSAEPQAKIFVERPRPEPLSRGVALFQFRTENLQIVPVFGPAAATVSPRIGHLHMTLDDTSWHWAHTSNDPVIVADLAPGLHKILFELADANHNVIAQEVVRFEVPKP